MGILSMKPQVCFSAKGLLISRFTSLNLCAVCKLYFVSFPFNLIFKTNFPVVQEPIQYYEEEISSNIAPTYNPGYVVKEPAPFQSFVNEQLESSSHLSDHHSRDRPREEHHSRLSGERRFHEERVGQHVLVPPMVPDHNSRSGHHESRSGHHHDSRHPETRHSETRHSESRHSETRHTEERQYEHQQEEKRHHQDRHSDDRAHRRGAAERGRHGHHSEDRGRHGHSSRYPEEGERYREERSRGGQVYQDSVQTMRGESPANRYLCFYVIYVI